MNCYCVEYRVNGERQRFTVQTSEPRYALALFRAVVLRSHWGVITEKARVILLRDHQTNESAGKEGYFTRICGEVYDPLMFRCSPFVEFNLRRYLLTLL